MPFSYSFHDPQVVQFVSGLKPKRILDIGPGAGKWGRLLAPLAERIDCVEIHEPYVHQFKLQSIYHQVYVGNVMDFSFEPHDYSLAIVADILEHLAVLDAQVLLERMRRVNLPVLVLVPYNYEQGECHDNPFEKHEQPELTEELFHERYPGFAKVCGNHLQGVFYRGSFE